MTTPAKPVPRLSALPGGEAARISASRGQVWILGLSHRSTPVELRERLAFPGESLAAAAHALRSMAAVHEAVIVSTCNRVEIVVVVDPAYDPAHALTTFLAHERQVPASLVVEHRYLHRGRDAIRHLFRVAASLDSMMVGEPQILGQMKEQYRVASEAGASGRILQRCFERAFRVAKRIRNETGIASRAVSVSSAAVDLARRIFDRLDDKTAMIVGAGKMSQLAARHLLGHGIGSVIATNRSFDRAVELARLFRGTPVPFERFPQYLHLADVVIGSVATTGYLVSPAQLADVLRARRRRPMFFIDLGVPRNFDPAINDLDNVYLYDIDDLSSVAEDHRAEREKEAVRGEEIAADEADRFWRTLSGRDPTPTIRALRDKLDGIRRAELDRALRALGHLGEAERHALEAMTLAIVNKILHPPVSLLKQCAHAGSGPDADDDAADVTELVHRLFALPAEWDALDVDESNEPGPAANEPGRGGRRGPAQ